MTNNSGGGAVPGDRPGPGEPPAQTPTVETPSDEPTPAPAARGRRPDGKPLDAEDVRLIEAARDVLAQQGVKATGTDDIARAAGVTRVTLYRRLGTRDDILRRTYEYEADRYMRSITARFTRFDSLEWDPARHVEDLLVGTVLDIRDSPLMQRLLDMDPEEAVTLLTAESQTVLWGATELVAEFIRLTWAHDVHSRPIDPDEAEVLSRQLAAVVGRFLHSVVVMRDGPPAMADEDEIRRLARVTLVPMILQR